MKVLTILQPYATLIALGAKHVETRGWKPSDELLGRLPCPLLIHAGRSPAMLRDCYQEPVRSILRKHGITKPSDLPFGSALAVTQVIAFSRTEVLVKAISPTERHMGNYVPGRWGWELRGTRRLQTPFVLRGAQGLFDWLPPPGFVWQFCDDVAAASVVSCRLSVASSDDRSDDRSDNRSDNRQPTTDNSFRRDRS